MKKERLKRLTVAAKHMRLQTRVKIYSQSLNANLPKSEIWFQDIYNQYRSNDKYDLFKDKMNEPVGKYIGDCVNHGYRYIIEIDGSFHDKDSQKIIDQRKDRFFQLRNYKIFRVKSYDDKTLDLVIKEIQQLRDNHPRSKGRR